MINKKIFGWQGKVDKKLSGEKRSKYQMLYVSNLGHDLYLFKEACRDPGLVLYDFPTVAVTKTGMNNEMGNVTSSYGASVWLQATVETMMSKISSMSLHMVL